MMFSAHYQYGAFMGGERVRTKRGVVVLPSSIDVRPMEERGENAYAQMELL